MIVYDPAWIERVHIRTVRREDLPGLEWDGEYTHYRRLYADAYERACKGRAILWVAELAGTGLIGQAFVQLLCDRPELADGDCRAYMYGFRIREAYRNRGLGSRMLAVMEQDLRKRGFTQVTLNVARDNERARKLYERHGYQVVGHEPGIWSYQDHQGQWRSVEEPAWRMEKKL